MLDAEGTESLFSTRSAFFGLRRHSSTLFVEQGRDVLAAIVDLSHNGQPSRTKCCCNRSCYTSTAHRIYRPRCFRYSSNCHRRRSYCRRRRRHRRRSTHHYQSRVNNPSNTSPRRRSPSIAVLLIARSGTWGARRLDVYVLTTAVQRNVGIFFIARKHLSACVAAVSRIPANPSGA